MKLSYDDETDSLYIELREQPGASAIEVAEGVVFDLDENGRLVGIDIQHASKVVDLTRLEAIALPA